MVRASSDAGRNSMTAGELVVDTELRDRQLMLRIAEGDREAFATLVHEYWKPLLRYAHRFRNDADSAEDVVQETLVRVWRFRAEWRPSGTVAGYLYRITRNLSLNAIRDESSRAQRHERGGRQLLNFTVSSSPVELAEAASLRRAVERAVAALPEKRREVFILARYHGLTHREIADTLELSIATVSNQMTSALAQLRTLLADHLGDR